MECSENTRLPGFWFFRQGENCCLRGARREELRLGGWRNGGCVYTNAEPEVQRVDSDLHQNCGRAQFRVTKSPTLSLC
jgi:hypothetical protein